MRILLSLLLLYVISFSADEKILRIYNWSDYISIDLLKRFSQKYNVKIEYETYTDSQEMYSKIQNNNKYHIDLIFPSANFVHKLIDENLLIQLDKQKIPNLKNINSSFFVDNFYSVPYLWGTLGIIYHKNIKSKPTSWNDLWNEKYKNSLLIPNSAEDMLFITLKALNTKRTNTTKITLDTATDKLSSLSLNLKKVTSTGVANYFIKKAYEIGIVYSGDALNIVSQNSDFIYLYPKEGTIRWVDSMAIPKNAKEKELAYEFINFILEPSNSVILAKTTGYSLPNEEGNKLINKSNKIQHPDKQIITNSELYYGIDKIDKEYIKRLEIISHRFNNE